MSLLKKFLSSNLTRYENEQKKRYKKYVKIQKREAMVVQKTEAELYEDTVEKQRSLRQSKRRAPVRNQEIVFKEPSGGLSLGPAPAILETTNRYVIVEDGYQRDADIPKKEITVNPKPNSVGINHIPPVPQRKKTRRSLDLQKGVLEEKDLRLSLPNQTVVEKYQAREESIVSISTNNSDVFFDCINELSDPFEETVEDSIIANTQKVHIVEDWYSFESPAHKHDQENSIPKDTSTRYEATSKEFVPKEAAMVFNDFTSNKETTSKYELYYREPVITTPTNTQNTIGNPKEGNITIEDQKWKPQAIVIIEELNPFAVVDNVKEDPPQQTRTYEPMLHHVSENPISSTKTGDDEFISSDSEDDGAINQTFNDYAVLETYTVQSPFQVSKEKTKFDDADNQSQPLEIQPKTNQETNLIIFSDNYSEIEEEEGVILDDKTVNDNRRHASSSSEDDVFEIRTNRKVNFDFANSFCATYEPVRQPSISDDASLTSSTTDEEDHSMHNFLSIDNQIYINAPPDYRDDFRNYDENAYSQKDDIYKNFGVGLDKREKKPLEPIFESQQSMDLVLLNCKNGFKETDDNEDEELDQFSETDSIDLNMNTDKSFQEYYDRIGDFKTDNKTPKTEKISISDIEYELSEIKKLDDVVTQIDQIQHVLNRIHVQIEQMESRDDEKYTPLLKTLLSSMKILGNLNCNFDEELLNFQQESMEYISKCIKSLNEL